MRSRARSDRATLAARWHEQLFERGVEISASDDHEAGEAGLRRAARIAAVLGRVQAFRCAPALRAPSAAWTRPARGGHEALIVEGRPSSSNGKVRRRSQIVRDVARRDRARPPGAGDRRRVRGGIAVRLQEPHAARDAHAGGEVLATTRGGAPILATMTALMAVRMTRIHLCARPR